jgi:hypothetical protein
MIDDDCITIEIERNAAYANVRVKVESAFIGKGGGYRGAHGEFWENDPTEIELGTAVVAETEPEFPFGAGQAVALTDDEEDEAREAVIAAVKRARDYAMEPDGSEQDWDMAA